MVCLGSQFDDWSIMVEKVGQRELETVIPMASFERRERGEGQEGGGGGREVLSSFFLFIQPRPLAPGMMLATFRVALSSSGKPLRKHFD